MAASNFMARFRSSARHVLWACPAIAALAGTAHADGVRDFNADTPGKSYTPYTVAEGYFQVESDSFHITEMTGSRSIETADPVFKYGLTDDIELELQTGGFFNLVSTVDGRTVSLNGYGDTVPEIKWNFFGNDWDVFSAALKAGVKLPTASPGLGNGAVEYYAILPTQLGLPDNITLQIQQEIDVLKTPTGTGKYFSFSEDVALSRAFGKFTVSVELFAQSGTDHASPAMYTADGGLGYALTPAVVVSFGTYVGLNRHTPEVESYTGFAFRF